MKTKLLIFSVMALLIVFGGCDKTEDWWNNTDHMRAKHCRAAIAQKRLGEKAGKLAKKHEDAVDRDRSGYTLERCYEIATMYDQEMIVCLNGEIISELANLISVLSTEYRTQKDEGISEEAKERRKEELWDRFGGGNKNILDPELSRVLRCYPDALIAVVRGYVLDTLLFNGGTREHNGNLPANEREVYILGLYESQITWGDYEDWWVTYNGEYFWYMYFFAIDPANYAEAKSAGLPTPSLEEMRLLYPPEKISEFQGKSVDGKTDLQLFREYILTQVDYTQPDWKPKAVVDIQQ